MPIFNDQNFNDTLTNNIVSFEQWAQKDIYLDTLLTKAKLGCPLLTLNLEPDFSWIFSSILVQI